MCIKASIRDFGRHWNGRRLLRQLYVFDALNCCWKIFNCAVLLINLVVCISSNWRSVLNCWMKAAEVLQALRGRSRFAIVTNGLQAIHRSRLAHSAIRDYISALIISEEEGSAKPHGNFFETASASTGHPVKSEVLIIGDSLTSDMQGDVDYGIDTCWFNPASEPRPDHLPITYEIKNLRELLDIVE